MIFVIYLLISGLFEGCALKRGCSEYGCHVVKSHVVWFITVFNLVFRIHHSYNDPLVSQYLTLATRMGLIVHNDGGKH